MSIDVVIGVLVVLGVVTAVAAAAVADRAARESAWRRIALERRWNQEHYRRRP